jgi:hypothetical protein
MLTSGTFLCVVGFGFSATGYEQRRAKMHSLIYLVGLIVVVLLILSFFGLR